MRTKPSTGNPYRYNRYSFAWENVPKGSAAHLDFGCGDGRFLASLTTKGIQRLVGADISRDMVKRARQKFPQLEIIHLSKTAPLPFENLQFTSITLLDVFEHINEQNVLLDELNRILKDDGILIVTVPKKHIFSGFDAANFKFRFPKLHSWYHCRRYSRKEYEYHYVHHPDGLVGDISESKHWHEHFSGKKLSGILAKSGFHALEFDGSGFFDRIIRDADYLSQKTRLLHRFFRKIETFDAMLFKSANLFCVACKDSDNKANTKCI